MNIQTPPPFVWQDYRPLAIAETTRFYGRLKRGPFKFKDLLCVAEAALATSEPGSTYARKAIKGALADFVRDDLTIVKPVEMKEDRYLSTVAELDDCLPTARAVGAKPCDIPSDNPLVEDWRKRHGVKMGPEPRRIRRRVRHPITGKWLELLPSRLATSSGYRVTSRHGKVPVSIGRSSYIDEWNQQLGGWERAKIVEDDEDYGDFDLRSEPIEAKKPGVRAPQSEPAKKPGVYPDNRLRKKPGDGPTARWATTCHNAGVDHIHGLGADWTCCAPRHPGRRHGDKFVVTGKLPLKWGSMVDDHADPELAPPELWIIRQRVRTRGLLFVVWAGRFFVPLGWHSKKALKLVPKGEGIPFAAVEPQKVAALPSLAWRSIFSLDPVPKDKLGRWREQILLAARLRVEGGAPRFGAPSWHADANYFDVEWGPLSHFPQADWELFHRAEDGLLGRLENISPLARKKGGKGGSYY